MTSKQLVRKEDKRNVWMRRGRKEKPVVVEDVSENLWVPIKEILFEHLIKKEVFLIASQQGVRVLFEGVLPRLEPSPAHIYHNLLVLGFPTSFALRWRGEGV